LLKSRKSKRYLRSKSRSGSTGHSYSWQYNFRRRIAFWQCNSIRLLCTVISRHTIARSVTPRHWPRWTAISSYDVARVWPAPRQAITVKHFSPPQRVFLPREGRPHDDFATHT